MAPRPTTRPSKGSIPWSVVAGIATACLFVLAATLSQSAAVARPDPPTAGDVRAARRLALDISNIAARPGSATVTIPEADLRRAARVLSNGAPRLRAAPRSRDGRFDLLLSYRLAAHTWINGALYLAERPGGGTPRISARIGSLPVPAPIVGMLAEAARRLLPAAGGARFPGPAGIVRAFRARPAYVTARLAIPREVLATARNFSQAGNGIDEALMRALYARLLNRHGGPAPQQLAALYRTLFETAPEGGEDARAYARAAMIAVAMATVDARVRRLGERGDRKSPPCAPEPLNVTLAGRADLAKHFSLSAALAAATDPELGRALGTWKELDDSLPGGEGFSFVDLSADRAGLRLGRAANSPRAAGLARMLARPGAMLLPVRALAFSEGLHEREFEARYRRIDSAHYAEAMARIDRALDTSPLLGAVD